MNTDGYGSSYPAHELGLGTEVEDETDADPGRPEVVDQLVLMRLVDGSGGLD